MGVIVNIQGIVFTWLHKFPKTLPLHSAFGEIQTGDLSSASWACVVSVNANQWNPTQREGLIPTRKDQWMNVH